MYCNSPSIFLNLSFGCAGSILCFCWTFSLIGLRRAKGSTEMSSPQRKYSEPSLSQRRALAISITSPRQLVESKGAVLSIHTSPPPAPLRGREEREAWRVKSGVWRVEREGWRLGGGCQYYRLHVPSSLINHYKATLSSSIFLSQTYVIIFCEIYQFLIKIVVYL